MVHFLLFPLLLGSVREATALVLSSQQRLQPTTTLALDRRQATVTKFSTVFSTGDRSKIRTADSGFEFRVDVLNGLWGVCATSDADVKDCGMAGSCVDSFSCSKGCGFTGEALPTFTCSDSKAAFCSTALLALATNTFGPFTYLACGAGPRTDEYKAFTTKPTTSSSVATPDPIVQTPGPILPSSTTTTSKSTSQSASATTTTVTTSLPPGSPLNATTTLQVTTTTNSTAFPTSIANPERTPPNIAAIVGAIAGCLTLLGIIITIAIILRRRRNLKSADPTKAKLKKHPRPSSSSSSFSSSLKISAPLPVVESPKAELDAQVRALELSGRGAAAYDTSERHPVVGWGRCYPAMSPVELQGEWPAGGWGSSGR